MSEMVERVAKAMAEALSGSPSYVEADNLSSATIDGCFDLREVATAAIEAMREPTEAMLDRGPGEPYMDRAVWAGMIDATLT